MNDVQMGKVTTVMVLIGDCELILVILLIVMEADKLSPLNNPTSWFTVYFLIQLGK